MEELKLKLYQNTAGYFSTNQLYESCILVLNMISKAQILIAGVSNWIDVIYFSNSSHQILKLETTKEEAWAGGLFWLHFGLLEPKTLTKTETEYQRGLNIVSFLGFKTKIFKPNGLFPLKDSWNECSHCCPAGFFNP